MPAPTDPVPFPIEPADAADVIEQNSPLGGEDDVDDAGTPDPIDWESDSADVLEQRIEIGYEDEHDDAG